MIESTYKECYTEARKSEQKALTISITMSLICLTYALNTESKTTIFGIPLDEYYGVFILLGIYVSSGFYMLMQGCRAEIAAYHLRENPELLKALKCYPTVLNYPHIIRFITIGIPIVIMSAVFYFGVDEPTGLGGAVGTALVISGFQFLSAIPWITKHKEYT